MSRRRHNNWFMKNGRPKAQKAASQEGLGAVTMECEECGQSEHIEQGMQSVEEWAYLGGTGGKVVHARCLPEFLSKRGLKAMPLT